MYTTLNEILKHKPCGQNSKGATGFSKLLKFLGKEQADDEPLSFITILESNGILDAIWCLRVLPDCDLKVMKFKLLCARRVEHLDESGVAKNTLDVLERFINGDASRDELREASAAAHAAAYAAYAAYAANAAYAAAYAAHAAAYAAYAAYAAAYAAHAAAAHAANVVDAAADAAAYAAHAAAYAAHAAAHAANVVDADAERDYQAKIFRDIFGGAGDDYVKSDGKSTTNK